MLISRRRRAATAVFLARIVMPFSRSRSIESMTRSASSAWLPERAGLPEHGVDQGGLAVVDVGDDRDVAQVVPGGHDGSSLLSSGVAPCGRWPGSHGSDPACRNDRAQNDCASFGPGRAASGRAARHRRLHTLNVERTHGLGHPRHTERALRPPRPPDPTGTGGPRFAARTLRTDNWWQGRRSSRVILLTLWILYAMVRVFMQKWYWVEDYHYLTPFYSPCVSNGCVPATPRSSAGSCRTRDHPVRGADACRSCCCSG